MIIYDLKIIYFYIYYLKGHNNFNYKLILSNQTKYIIIFQIFRAITVSTVINTP